MSQIYFSSANTVCIYWSIKFCGNHIYIQLLHMAWVHSRNLPEGKSYDELINQKQKKL